LKKWRIYFNKKEDYPCIWSVDQGSARTEIRVQWFSVAGLPVSAGHRFGPQPPNNHEFGENEPTAWIEVNNCGACFQDGGVVFEKAKN